VELSIFHSQFLSNYSSRTNIGKSIDSFMICLFFQGAIIRETLASFQDDRFAVLNRTKSWARLLCFLFLVFVVFSMRFDDLHISLSLSHMESRDSRASMYPSNVPSSVLPLGERSGQRPANSERADWIRHERGTNLSKIQALSSAS